MIIIFFNYTCVCSCSSAHTSQQVSRGQRTTCRNGLYLSTPWIPVKRLRLGSQHPSLPSGPPHCPWTAVSDMKWSFCFFKLIDWLLRLGIKFNIHLTAKLTISPTLKIFLLHLIYLLPANVCVCVHAHMPQLVYGILGTICGSHHPSLPPCGFYGSNSDYQVWWQALYQLSHVLRFVSSL